MNFPARDNAAKDERKTIVFRLLRMGFVNEGNGRTHTRQCEQSASVMVRSYTQSRFRLIPGRTTRPRLAVFS